MKIYTKTGDGGETSLFSGVRVSKSHKLIESFGLLDELNTNVGGLISSLEQGKLDGEFGFDKDCFFLADVQRQIFSMGSYLASEFNFNAHIDEIPNWIEQQELYMDKLDDELPELKNFILPGGSAPACRAHECRVLVRKIERFLVGADLGPELKIIIVYLNRLSDFFFVFARAVNFRLGIEEAIWKA